jgi:chaperonin GroES
MNMKKTKKSKKTPSPKKGLTHSFKIQPLGDKVVIKELEENETGRKTDSGIYIPDTVKEDREGRRGKVMAVGAGRMENGKRIPLEVKVGDTVLFSWGDKATIDGTDYYIISESSLIAILK